MQIKSALILCLCACTVTIAGPPSRSNSGTSSRFSGGSSSTSSRPSAPSSSSRFSGGSSNKPSPSTPHFTGGSSKPAASSGSFPPKATDVGSSVAKARTAQQSAAQKSQSVAARTQSGKAVKVDATVTARVSPSAQSTRNVRITRVYTTNHYGGWYSHPYHDAFHPMFTGYLLGRLSDPYQRPYATQYIYHHWDSFDSVRQQELLRENAGLRADLDHMRAGGVVQNAGYTIPDMDPDLVYNDNVASTVFYSGPGFFSTLWWLTKWVFRLALVGFLVYSVFFWRSSFFRP